MNVSSPMAEAAEKPPLVDAYGRLKGVEIVKPIVYGNTARYLNRKLDNGHTHTWKLFLRPYHNEEAQRWIRKVSFKLHDSYVNQTRVLEAPPWSVEESGWGEFEVVIKIYFVDPNEKPVTAFHILKLFQNDPDCIAGAKNVVSEIYDEIIFVEPSSFLFQRLKATEGKPIKSGNETDFEEKKRRTLDVLGTARGVVRSEIEELREALKDARVLLDQLSEKTKALEEGPPSTPTPAASAAPSPTPE